MFAILAVLLIAGGLWAWKGRGQASTLKFETVKVDRGRIVARVTATGTVSALVTVQVGSQVSGRIAELKVDFNSKVKKGDLLARIDQQIFLAALEQARANNLAGLGNLSKAKVQAADADRQLARTQGLFQRELVAQAELDTAKATAEVAHAEVSVRAASVEQTQAALHQAQINLAYTSITSPIDGVVISRAVDVGQTVAASLQAPTLFMIAEDLRKMQVDTSVAEADIGKLQPGMASSFTVDAFPNERFTGTIRQIRSAPQTVQNVVTYDAVIDVANEKLQLRPGMTANVTFVQEEKDNVLRMPNAALRFRPPAEMTDGGTRRSAGGGDRRGEGVEERLRAVYVLREGAPTRLEVRTGLSDGSFTEVLEGALREGDEAITDATGSEAAKPNPAGGGGGPNSLRRVF